MGHTLLSNAHNVISFKELVSKWLGLSAEAGAGAEGLLSSPVYNVRVMHDFQSRSEKLQEN